MGKLTSRQESLLASLIREYVKTAEPVGSASLASSSRFDVSPATVRNELAELEAAGYIAQPHTSAGRVPTEKGFRHYIARMQDVKNDGATDTGVADVSLRSKGARTHVRYSSEEMVREVARRLAEASEEVAIVALDPRRLYYTGIAYLFSQPEFQEGDLIVRFSEVMDELDRFAARLLARAEEDIVVLIGRETPFGTGAGMVLARYGSRGTSSGLLGLVGPVRMDYDRNVLLVQSARELLEELEVS